MIFTRYSLQFEQALKNLTPNTEQATKKQNAFWAGFRKKEESYYFFPDPVILINNEPSLRYPASVSKMKINMNLMLATGKTEGKNYVILSSCNAHVTEY